MFLGKLRIVTLADTHTQHHKLDIPTGDILIYAGDISGNGEPWEIERFNNWLFHLPHKHKLIIAGNHDRNFTQPSYRPWITNGTYLLDETVIINGINFYGSPWTPEFENWAFMKPRGAAMKSIWAQIPFDTDVLITHGPPKGILDRCPNNEHAGCEELLAKIQQVRPKLHIFGHIHTCGVVKDEHTSFYNASVVNHQYQLTHQPIIIDIEENWKICSVVKEY